MTYKLFIDDIRNPPDRTYVVVRSVKAAIEYVETYDMPIYVSFDHDLGSNEDSPVFAKYLIEKVLDGLIPKEDFLKMGYHVHSANPVGRKNLESLIDGFKAYLGE